MTDLVANLLGYTGTACAFALFVSPIPTYRRIIAEADVLSFSALPALTQLVESTFWLLWAVSMGGRTPIIVVNVAGILSQLIFLAIFSYYTPPKRARLHFLHLLGALFGIAVACSVYLLSMEASDAILSSGAVAINIIKYGAPLSVLRLVVETKSNEFLPIWLTLACLACGLLWGSYGIVLHDPWVVVPNVAGVILTTVQVALWVKYNNNNNNSSSSSCSSKSSNDEADDADDNREEEENAL